MSQCRDYRVIDEESLSVSSYNINQVKSKNKKPRALKQSGESTMQTRRKISCNFYGCEHAPDRKRCSWGIVCKRCNEKNHFARRCKKTFVYIIESDEELEEISVVRIQAVKENVVFPKMLVKQKPVRFQIDCGQSANIRRASMWKILSSLLVPSPWSCGMASTLRNVHTSN